MRYVAIADTDVGTTKDTNQDSVLIKHGTIDGKEILLTIVCDGMGGLAKGELASATVIRDFNRWFIEELPFELEQYDLRTMAGLWVDRIRSLNSKIMRYATDLNVTMGTTFTGTLFVDGEYFTVHVGDTRFYRIDSVLEQLTEDQTFIAREIKRGNMTPEQAKTDRRRNMLLQCVGASDVVNPEVLFGNVARGAYMICSDGFRHVITEQEIYESLNPINLHNKDSMHANVRYLIDLVKQRRERDNISVILIKVE